ncbi:MAG: MFS transporter, partial [Alphaproteobacteria bacterium]|nr:MFS transporter [Alphaproteobacteria bacterium]
MSSKILLTVVIGTILEYFDFFLFAHFSLIIAPHFFSDLDPIISSIEGLSLLSIGFIMRPLGAIFFGKIGDFRGRKFALSFAILWTSVPTFIISCLPTHCTIGVLAPIILILCRMGQGFFVGGEYTNAGIFLMEHAPLKKRGFYSSILCISASLGSLMALACAFVILNCDSPSWAWRVPFFLASVCGFIGYKFRTILIESPEISSFQNDVFKNTQKPIWELIAQNKKAFFVTIASGALVGALISTPVTYTNFYL